MIDPFPGPCQNLVELTVAVPSRGRNEGRSSEGMDPTSRPRTSWTQKPASPRIGLLASVVDSGTKYSHSLLWDSLVLSGSFGPRAWREEIPRTSTRFLRSDRAANRAHPHTCERRPREPRSRDCPAFQTNSDLRVRRAAVRQNAPATGGHIPQ